MVSCLLLVRWADTVADPALALLGIAQRFSPRVAWVEPRAVVVDLHGLERLFGTPRAIGEQMRRALAQAGLEAHVAVAGTRTSARLLAHARAGLTVIAPGTEAAALAGLPLGLLACLDEEAPASSPPPDAAPRASARFYRTSPVQQILRPTRRRRAGTPLSDRLRLFRQWGLRTLGDLAARLGADGPALQALARGEDPAPLVPLVEEERFEARLELEWPIDGLEPLSFVLGRLCDPVSAHLDRRGRAAAALCLDLTLVTRTTWTRRLELPSPMKDPRTFRTLLLLDLESHPPPAAIDVVTVRVEPTPARVLQHSLLERARPRPEQTSTLVARLSALMGARRVGRPVLVDSHRPDAFELALFTGEAAAGTRPSAPDQGPGTGRPTATPALRRFRPPVPARVDLDEGRPVRLRAPRADLPAGAIDAATGPWRTSGEWWASDTAWDHDEWDVTLDSGPVCRLSRDRLKDRWYLAGLYD